MKNIFVIIPAINEEDSIGRVLRDIPSLVDEIVVVDNGSIDDTVNEAKKFGATVLIENERGYGAACLKGMEYLASKTDDNDVIVFLDGDYSDHPEEMPGLVEPIVAGEYDMIIGSRILGKNCGMTTEGALLPQAEFGNWLSTRLISLIWGYKFTDLGPFRAVSSGSLKRMKMADRNYGWTVEMQIKAAKLKLKCKEIPVSYRKRIGVSKVTGTVSGSVKAGVKILSTIFVQTIK